MSERIVGRRREAAQLMDSINSSKPEFVAVYGRRRIGKTFLIKQMLGKEFSFYMTGIYQSSRSELLSYFKEQLEEYSGERRPKPKNWFEAFSQLRQYLKNLLKKNTRCIVFIDELPWLDTPKSDFIRALDLFWNGWASDQENIKLIVCGSATTWMTNKLLGDKGGLHNRVTRKIYLAPFTLGETAEFLENKGVVWTKHQIAECYMALGGTPFYLDMLDKSLGLPQNIDKLFFEEGAELAKEYDILFRSLFNNASLYRKVVELLAKRSRGMNRAELLEALNIPSGGSLSEVLDNLVSCDFLRKYSNFGNKSKEAIYQLTDMYTLFYLKFVKERPYNDDSFWTNGVDSPSHRAWCGYAFEQLCLHHIPQIKEKLGISGISANVYSWSQRSEPNAQTAGAQIDLVIDRRDQIINLCEMKFSLAPFEITEKYFERLVERRELFRSSTLTTKALHLTFVTSNGLKPNAQSQMIQSQVTLDDLFC